MGEGVHEEIAFLRLDPRRTCFLSTIHPLVIKTHPRVEPHLLVFSATTCLLCLPEVSSFPFFHTSLGSGFVCEDLPLQEAQA